MSDEPRHLSKFQGYRLFKKYGSADELRLFLQYLNWSSYSASGYGKILTKVKSFM
jgi:hypothetical protein